MKTLNPRFRAWPWEYKAGVIYVAELLGCKEAARRFGVPERTVRYWRARVRRLKRYRELLALSRF